MPDEHRPDDPTVGSQPEDIEQLQYGKGPSESELLPPDTFLGHPKGLWVLFITEMWERFSYYGMRALLVLYLISSTNDTLANGDPNSNPGFGWTEDSAYSLYGWYTWAVYLTPIAGGWLADKFLGTHRSMLIGAWIISAGHITLALTELFGYSAGEAVTLQTGPGALLTFMFGLFLIVVGTGFFKPCVSVMVGQLYPEGDVRRDSGFSIFYMGINLGAFLSPLIAGTLGETVGWHWGFGSAAVGMIAGLITYQILRPKYLAGIGDPPAKKAADPSTMSESARAEHEKKVHEQTRPLVRKDWERIAVILVLAFVGNIFFWAAFEQAGTSMNVFAAKQTDRSLYGTMGERAPLIPPPELLAMSPLADESPLAEDAPNDAEALYKTLQTISELTSADEVKVYLYAAIQESLYLDLMQPDGELDDDEAVQPLIDLHAARLATSFHAVLSEVKSTYSMDSFDIDLKVFNEEVQAAHNALRDELGIGAEPSEDPDWVTTLDSLLRERIEDHAHNQKQVDEYNEALEAVDKDGWFPATWYQSVNALTIVIFAPIFGVMWVWLDKRRLNPSSPMKFALGLYLLGLAFVAMIVGAMQSRDGGFAAPHWLFITYVVYTWGELCLSPVGLSLVTKLAPYRLQSLMMGVWFFTFSLANLLAAQIARISTRLASGEWEFIIPGMPGFYLMLVIGPIAAGVLIMFISPILRRMMHGVK